MFRVDHFQRVSHGEYRVVLILDDPGMLPMIRFLRSASAFAETLHSRIDLERRVLELTDRRREAAPAQRAERARILALYRTLPGPRKERLKTLRSVLKDQYPRIGYDDVRALISLGVADERAFRRTRAAQLAGEGLSCRQVAERLMISPAQAFRLQSPQRAKPRGCPTIDDLTPGVQDGTFFGIEGTGGSHGGRVGAIGEPARPDLS
jgi:hypothetical protein